MQGNGTPALTASVWVGEDVHDQKWRVGQVIRRCHIFWFVVEKKNATVIVESSPFPASLTASLWSTCSQASVKVD